VSPYAKYKAPPFAALVHPVNVVCVPLVPVTVNDVCDPGTMIDTHPPFPVAWALLNVFLLSVNGKRLGVAICELMLIAPPFAPLYPSLKVLESNVIAMASKEPASIDTAPPFELLGVPTTPARQLVKWDWRNCMCESAATVVEYTKLSAPPFPALEHDVNVEDENVTGLDDTPLK